MASVEIVDAYAIEVFFYNLYFINIENTELIDWSGRCRILTTEYSIAIDFAIRKNLEF